MEDLTCNNCGARINRRTNMCDYCGTAYVSKGDIKEDRRTQRSFVIPKLTDEQILNDFRLLQNGALLIFPVIFLSVWTLISLGITIAVFTTATFFVAFMPMIFVAVGITLMIKLIKEYGRENPNKVISLCEAGDWQQAYSISKEKAVKSQKFLLMSLLLAYHKFDDDQYLQQNAVRVTDKTLSGTTNHTNDFCVLVEKYTTRQ